MEQDLNSILEQQLRSLHMPEAVSWWPPAPGWWVLFAALMFLTGFAVLTLYKHIQKNRYRKLARNELEAAYSKWQGSDDNSQYVQLASAVIKRSIIAAGGEVQVASQTGQQWTQTINHWAKTPLSDQASQAMIDAGYRANPNIDIDDLHQQLDDWLRSHRKPKAAAAKGPAAKAPSPEEPLKGAENA